METLDFPDIDGSAFRPLVNLQPQHDRGLSHEHYRPKITKRSEPQPALVGRLFFLDLAAGRVPNATDQFGYSSDFLVANVIEHGDYEPSPQIASSRQ
jgi:hypothetical protein